MAANIRDNRAAGFISSTMLADAEDRRDVRVM